MRAVLEKTETLAFMERLAEARERVLFLDYDGTIAPFTPVRTRAFPYPQVHDLLDSIGSTCATRTVVVSGRPAREIPGLLGKLPLLEIWGSHGLERLHPDGRYEASSIPQEVTVALDHARVLLVGEGCQRFTEQKLGALAVHLRGLPPSEIESVRTRVYQVLAGIACRTSLRLAEFDGGLELRTRASHKGHAVRTVLSEIPEDAAVAYLGDDLTDEDAFQEVNSRGLSVLVRPSYRATQARAWIKPPGEVLQFLLDWIRSCGGEA